MSIYKGEDMIAGPTQQKFVRKPAWSRAVNIAISSLLSGSSYTAPADGIVVVSATPATNANNVIYYAYVNGVKISAAYHFYSNAFWTNAQIQVNAGDVVTTDLPTAYVESFASFIPFEDSIIVEPITITPEYIRNLHDPDWSQAESITAAQINSGWTATKRGIITGYIRPSSGSNTSRLLKVNNVTVTRGGEYTNVGWDGNVQVPVNSGDSVTADGTVDCDLHFVPYKQQ